MIKLGGFVCDECRIVIPKSKVRLYKDKRTVRHFCTIKCKDAFLSRRTKNGK